MIDLNCPRTEIGESQKITACLTNLKNIARLSFRITDEDDSFLAGGIDPEAPTAEEIKTALEDQATWETAIAGNERMLTPRTHMVTIESGDHEIEELEDQSVVWTGDVAPTVITAELKGLSKTQHTELLKTQGHGLSVSFFDKAGVHIGTDVVADQTKTDFPTLLVTVSDRNHETGSTADSVTVTIYVEYAALAAYGLFQTEDFGLVI